MPEALGRSSVFGVKLLVLLTANTVTYRRSPGPPLGRLAPRRCRLALTPGRPPQNGALRAGDGLARGRGDSGRPGGPGPLLLMYTSSNLRPRLLRLPRMDLAQVDRIKPGGANRPTN